MKTTALWLALSDISEAYIDDAAAALGLPAGENETGVSAQKDLKETTMNTKNGKKISKIVLIAAALAAALAVTALAAGLLGTGVHPANGVTGHRGENGWVNFEDTQLYVTFASDAPRHEAFFKANWLPSRPDWVNGSDPGGSYNGEYTDYLTNAGKGSIMPYEINTYNSTNLQGMRYCLNGAAEVLRQDLWNGFERTEIHVDYTGNEHITFESANYLLLFQPEDNYLIYIAGTDPMETMEKIAENLEIRVGEELRDLPEPGFDVAWFDIGRG